MASVAKVRDALQKALRKERLQDALVLYGELEEMEPTEPRWPHRRGDLCRRMGNEDTAVRCYERAVKHYMKLGFVARAAAMAKVILTLDPQRTDILKTVDPKASQRSVRPDLPEPPTTQASATKGPPPLPQRVSFDDAIVLEMADDADDDEIRFVDVEPDEEESIEIRVTMHDLESRPPSRTTTGDDEEILFIDVDAEPERMDVEALAEMPSMPLFAELPQEIFTKMLAEAELVELVRDDKLVEFKAISDSLFVIIEGQVEVQVPGRSDAEPILLGEGDIVGETSLLDDVQRGADVVATGPCQALKITKASLDSLVEQHPGLGSILLELLGRRLISNLLQTSPVFAAFDLETRRELAGMFELRRANEGTVLVEAGKRSDGLYCTLLGELEFALGDQSRRVAPGAVFGQRSLLSREPSKLDVRAGTDMLVLRLPAQRFTELAALYPPVLMHLSQLSGG